jgi:hypothetical protein
MKWYYLVMGGHTHVRVFMNGANCGNLVFRNNEFDALRESLPSVAFIDEIKGEPEAFAETPKFTGVV